VSPTTANRIAVPQSLPSSSSAKPVATAAATCKANSEYVCVH